MVPLKLIDRGATSCFTAACAINVRMRLYASMCVQISLRTNSGVLQRSSRICIVYLIERKSSSLCHRARYSAAKSSLVVCCASINVVTTTNDLVRKPGCVTRILVSRIVMYSGSALYVFQSSERIEEGLNQ